MISDNSNDIGVTLVTQTRVHPEKNGEFSRWQDRVSKVVATFPGYLSHTIVPPNLPIQEDWVIMQRFSSADAAKTWLRSPERQKLLENAKNFLVGLDDVYLLEEKSGARDAVTATITAKIRPEDGEKFLQWHSRIAAVQSKFPGFIGCRLEKPRQGINDAWITIVTFDSDNHLEAWLKSQERAELVRELDTFTLESHVRKSSSGFGFWFKSDKKHVAWKENMLVVLTLYPVVFLLSYVQNPAMRWGVPFWLALFFSNALSTVILGYLTVPWLTKKFQWWLNPPEGLEGKYTRSGVILVILLYGLALLICWQLSMHAPS
jgi:antibiotic biosynthesis monooxygenase (ABM) superfamily enzyme